MSTLAEASPTTLTGSASTETAISIERTSFLSDLAALAKIRLTGMVVITTMVGFWLGGASGLGWTKSIWVGLGTWLVAGSAATLNQLFEISRDAIMKRTQHRPLPAGRILPSTAWMFAIVTALAGMALLGLGTNAITAWLGLANLVIYAFIYTPMKRLSTLNTLVGAICGGIPPMMGYTAATGHLAPAAIALGLLLFVWQIPHFLALAWLYRDEYEKAGFRMLPVVDRTGRFTCRMILLYSVLLIPASLAESVLGGAGVWYTLSALLLGCAMVALAVAFLRAPHRVNARKVFLASVIYLPLLLMAMVADTRPGAATTPVVQVHLLSAPGPSLSGR
jgi:protoheme IX farnesyltransferase